MGEQDYTEIRDEVVRGKICELMSEMLDNPDEYGIFPTSRFMWEMETFILGREEKMKLADKDEDKQGEIARLSVRVEKLEDGIRAEGGEIPGHVIVCEDGADEDVLASLAVSVGKFKARCNELDAGNKSLNSRRLEQLGRADQFERELKTAKSTLEAAVKQAAIVGELLEWAQERKESETAHRPDGNIHRRTLVATWNQVIGKLRACRAS